MASVIFSNRRLDDHSRSAAVGQFFNPYLSIASLAFRQVVDSQLDAAQALCDRSSADPSMSCEVCTASRAEERLQVFGILVAQRTFRNESYRVFG